MSLKGILKVGDEVFVDVVDSEGVSRGDVLEFYRQEYVTTVGRKYITTERYGKTYKYDIETGVEVTDFLDKRKLFLTYNQLLASRYYGKLYREITSFYINPEKQDTRWYPVLDALRNLSEIVIW